jgi:inhibitor of cysteine peptidase
VDSIDVFIKESFPVQVSVQVYGNLADGCASIQSTEAKFDGKDSFEVHIYTTQPKDVMCTQALVPFEENIPLDVYGLPAGTYTVNVYDLKSTFKIEVENK